MIRNKSTGLDISKATLIDPEKYEKFDLYVDKLVELRKAKGMTQELARETMLNDYTTFGVMMVKMGDADGLVSGACHSSANTLRPCLQILKTAPGTKLVSAFFLMIVPDCNLGEQILRSSDSGSTMVLIFRLALALISSIKLIAVSPFIFCPSRGGMPTGLYPEPAILPLTRSALVFRF